MSFLSTSVLWQHSFIDVSLTVFQVHVSIQEWLTNVMAARKFTAELVESIYEDHISDLGKFTKRKLRSYHKTMFGIYSAATYVVMSSDSAVLTSAQAPPEGPSRIGRRC
jgi:hypothetical protein